MYTYTQKVPTANLKRNRTTYDLNGSPEVLKLECDPKTPEEMDRFIEHIGALQDIHFGRIFP